MPPQQGYALLDLGDGILDLGTHVQILAGARRAGPAQHVAATAGPRNLAPAPCRQLFRPARSFDGKGSPHALKCRDWIAIEGAPKASSLRLAAQDVALSRRKHGFDSRRERQRFQASNFRLK